MKIKYYSTNKKTEKVSLKKAILMGQAPDRGLFMPCIIPKLDITTISSFKNLNYADIASVVTGRFLTEEMPEYQIRRIAKEAYNFDVPIESLQPNCYVLRLDQGPSASFKDFASRFMARLMNYFSENKLLVLVATSGDTGGAVAHAFYNQSQIDVVITFPINEVSTRQRKQMTTLGKNVTSIAVRGKFDDCQALVKRAFSDPQLKSLNLTSANSINFARLLPQLIYYFYAYSRVCKKSEKVIFSVPSGNFGNLVSGLIAKRMGLPVKKFIVAVNKNDEFVKFLETGIYVPIKPSVKCLSNAMNVGHPSNLARLIDLYRGQMDENGFLIKSPDLVKIKRDMFAISIDDDETKRVIKNIYKKHRKILDPHGAVAWAGVQKYLNKSKQDCPVISLETAHPGKFPEELNKMGIFPRLPDSMKGLDKKREISSHVITNTDDSFKALLKNMKR